MEAESKTAAEYEAETAQAVRHWQEVPGLTVQERVDAIMKAVMTINTRMLAQLRREG